MAEESSFKEIKVAHYQHLRTQAAIPPASPTLMSTGLRMQAAANQVAADTRVTLTMHRLQIVRR